MSIGIRLLGNRVAIRPDEADSVSEGGIVLTGNQEKPLRGTVLAVGPGAHMEDGSFVETTVEEGNRVVYSRGGDEVEVDGENILVLPEPYIIGVLS